MTAPTKTPKPRRRDLRKDSLQTLLGNMLKPIKRDAGQLGVEEYVRREVTRLVEEASSKQELVDRLTAFVVDKLDASGQRDHLHRYRAELARRAWYLMFGDEPLPKNLAETE